MMNMQGLMKQAQMMQKKMEEAQKKLAESEVTGSSGGGMVKVTLNGKFEAKRLKLIRAWSTRKKPTSLKTCCWPLSTTLRAKWTP